MAAKKCDGLSASGVIDPSGKARFHCGGCGQKRRDDLETRLSNFREAVRLILKGLAFRPEMADAMLEAIEFPDRVRR